MQKMRFFWLLIGSLLVFSCSDLENGFSVKKEDSEAIIDVSAINCDNSSRTVTTGGIYGTRNMTFSGTVSGNSQIREIEVQIKRPEDELFLDFKKAEVLNGKWSVDLNFGDADFFLVKFCVANDYKQPASNTDSEIIIPIILDSDKESDSPLYIQGSSDEDRVSLMTKTTL